MVSYLGGLGVDETIGSAMRGSDVGGGVRVPPGLFPLTRVPPVADQVVLLATFVDRLLFGGERAMRGETVADCELPRAIALLPEDVLLHSAGPAQLRSRSLRSRSMSTQALRVQITRPTMSLC